MTQKIPPLASKQLEPLLVPITDLTPHPENYKSHPPEQIKQLRASVKAFGWTAPIKANLEGVIVGGHGMFQLALEDGYTHVPALFEALDDNLSKAYLIADNETARRAVTEQDKLNELLEGALGIPDFDIEAVGFSSEDIDTLLGSGEVGEVVEDEFNPDDVKESRCKEGDLWQLGKHRLICADSTDSASISRLMGGDSASLVVTDPPYNVDYTGKTADALKIKNDTMDDSSFYKFLLSAYTNMYNSLDDGGCIYVFHADTEGINFRKAMLDAGFKLSECLVWVKNSMVMGRQDYHWQHEPILYGWKPTAAHKWYSDRSQTTVWNFSRPTSSQDHPTMKPIDLISYPITNSSKAGDIVLDPFLGSGSTLIACEQLNRICYGAEIDPHYCDVILSRWEQFTNQTAKKLN